MTTRVLLPDRVLDALASEKVWCEFPVQLIDGVWKRDNGQTWDGLGWSTVWSDIPTFTQSLDAALLLVEALRAKGWGFTLRQPLTVEGWWRAEFYDTSGQMVTTSNQTSPALAVVVVALSVVGCSPYAKGEEAR